MEVSGYYKELCEKYTDRTAISGGMFEKAKLYLAGGETRTVSYYPPYPLTIVSGKGCLVRDADGNSYIDCVNNYTSLIHGHANEMIANAICDAARKGTAMPAEFRESKESVFVTLVQRLRCLPQELQRFIPESRGLLRFWVVIMGQQI